MLETGTNGTKISWGKFQKMRKLLNFRKANHSTEHFQKFQDESQMEREFPGKIFGKFGYTSRGCPLFRNLCKFAISYSGLASSFGRDHRELAISRKDDGDEYSNLSTYMSINLQLNSERMRFIKIMPRGVIVCFA